MIFGVICLSFERVLNELHDVSTIFQSDLYDILHVTSVMFSPPFHL